MDYCYKLNNDIQTKEDKQNEDGIVIKLDTHNDTDFVIDDDEMQRRQLKQELRIKNLIKEGHTCVSELECFPIRISWCNQNPCINSKKMNQLIEKAVLPQSKEIIIPPLIKIARDIDLVKKKPVGVVQIMEIEKMNQQNYQQLVGFDAKNFEHAITAYGCDICSSVSSENNPIYTNNKYQGADICTECITTAFQTIEELPGWNPGPIYSLKSICDLNKK